MLAAMTKAAMALNRAARAMRGIQKYTENPSKWRYDGTHFDAKYNRGDGCELKLDTNSCARNVLAGLSQRSFAPPCAQEILDKILILHYFL